MNAFKDIKASDLFVKALEHEGVEYIFGVPGEENLDLVESLRNSSIQLIVTRHEQGAGFMAATYGRLTGRVGVCLATLGAGGDQSGDAGSLRSTRRHADADDHRTEADQEEQTGALS